jgi:hypothetical protein
VFEESDEALTIKTRYRFEVERIESEFGSIVERLTGKAVRVEYVEAAA